MSSSPIPISTVKRESAHVQRDGILRLDDWLPYQCSIITNRVSAILKRMYAEKIGIGVSEWRLLANLAAHAPLSSKELAEHTAMDQVAVTRAVSLLVKKRLVSRRGDSVDRRRVVLRLSATGKDAYDAVAPLARAIEEELTSHIPAKQLAELRSMMEELVKSANTALHDDRDWRQFVADKKTPAAARRKA